MWDLLQHNERPSNALRGLLKHATVTPINDATGDHKEMPKNKNCRYYTREEANQHFLTPKGRLCGDPLNYWDPSGNPLHQVIQDVSSCTLTNRHELTPSPAPSDSLSSRVARQAHAFLQTDRRLSSSSELREVLAIWSAQGPPGGDEKC